MLALDLNGRIAWLGPAAEEWLERSKRKLAGRHVDDPELGGKLSSPSLAQARVDAVRGARVVTVRLGDGTPGEATVAPWWRAGELAGCVVTIRGARDRTGTDMEALAAGLAHEIRNPLAALRGAAELLQGELGPAPEGPPPPSTEYLRLILAETARVDALVRRMLDLARPPVLVRRPVQPSQLVHDAALHAIALAGTLGRKVQVVESFDPALPPLDADRDALFGALVNLVRNAVEASPDGARVVVEAGLDGERRQRVSGGRLSRVVRFAVVDEGPGLGSNEARLFTPFFTTKGTGTGLGLLLARRAVEAHGGRLLVSTRRARTDGGPGPGTEATVLVPMEAGDG